MRTRNRILALTLALALMASWLPVVALPVQAVEPETTEAPEQTEAFIEETQAPAQTETSAAEAGRLTQETAKAAQKAMLSEGGTTASGDCGEDMTWSFDETVGVLTITGSGAMNDYSDADPAPWLIEHCGDIRSVILSKGITYIGSYAFGCCEALTGVTLPESLTAVGTGAFFGCSSLTGIVIPESVASIEFAAFYDCTKLTNITFAHNASDTLTIGTEAFRLDLEEDVLEANPDGVATVIQVPDTDQIPPAVSGYDWSGSSRNVTYTSMEARPATAITVCSEDNIAEIEAGLALAFAADVTPSDATSGIVWSICEENSTGSGRISQDGVLVGTEPGLVTVRGTSSDDSGVYGETTVTILEPTAAVSGITVTSDGEFPGEVEAGMSVQMIAEVQPGNAADQSVSWSVQNGTGSASIDANGLLTGLTTGAVTVYAESSDGCVGSCTVNIVCYAQDITVFLNGKEDIRSLGIGEELNLSFQISPADATSSGVTWSVEDGTGSASIKTYPSYSDHLPTLTGVSAGTVTLTATANDSRKTAVSLELTVADTIAAYALSDGSGNLYYNTETGVITGSDSTVADVVIPARIGDVTITAIAPYAFAKQDSWGYLSDNTTLKSVVIPNTVREIGDYAFAQCTAMATLRFASGSSLTAIGVKAFYHCSGLTSLTLPNGLTTIAESAFAGCSGVITLAIPDSVTSVGRSAFSLWGYDSPSLKNLTLPGELDTSGWLYYDKLETVTFTGSRILSQPHTVDGSTQYYSILPGRDAEKVIISDSVTTIEEYAFANCGRLTEVSMGSGVTTIGAYAFYFCDSLTEVSMGSGVTTIGAYAFYYCDSLTQVELPEGIRSLGEAAFAECYSLTGSNLPQSLETIGKDCFRNCERLSLIDVSAVPDVIQDNTCSLSGKAILPAVLVSATGGKTELAWDGQSIEGEPDWYEIVWLYKVDGKDTLGAVSSGRFLLSCYDTYTGARGSKIVEVKAGTVIRPAETAYLISGEKLQLSAWQMPAEEKLSVRWSLGEGEEAFASISGSGLLTAKTVTAAHQITVTAVPDNGGESASKKLWILPKTTGLTLELDGSPLGQTLDVDMYSQSTLVFTVSQSPEGSLETVRWSSSASQVAEVDDSGVVTLHKPGTAVIKASAADGSGVSDSVTLNVIYLDAAKTLTASVDVPEIGLQPGQTAQMQVFGTEAIDREDLIFSIASTQSGIASVDAETGLITAGDQSGTATVIAQLKGDPLGRMAQAKVKVIPMQAQALKLSPSAEEPAQVQMLDASGSVTEDGSLAESFRVILSKADVAGESYSFPVTADMRNYTGQWQTAKNLKWASTDPSIAAVTSWSDGTAVVTVKAGVSGACAIQAVTTDLAKVSSQLWISVRDETPRLETNKLTLNSYQESGISVGLVESYGNTVLALRLYEYDPAEKAYQTEPSERLTAVSDDVSLTIRAGEPLKAGTYTLRLEADCANGSTYSFPLQLKVANKLPAVTAKQTAKFNLFYSDSAAVVKISAAGSRVSDAALTDTEDFRLEYDADEGVARLYFSDGYLNNPDHKPDTRAALLVTLDGYSVPAKVTFSIGTTSLKPKLSLRPSSSAVNISLDSEPSTVMRIWNQTAGSYVDLMDAEVEYNASFAGITKWDQELILTLTGSTGGTASIWVRGSNWMEAVKLTHKVTVETKLPSVKLGSTTLKLNRYFTMQTAQTTAALSQSNLTLYDLEFESTAAEGTALREQADKLSVWYDPDTGVIAQITDPEDAPKAGTYTFAYTGVLSDGTRLPKGTLRVSVASTLPKVKLTASSLRLNRFLTGEEIVSTGATVTGGQGYELAGFRELDGWDDNNIALEYVDGKLNASVLSGDVPLSRFSFRLTPVLRHVETDQEVELPTAVPLTVQVYSSEKLGVSLSSKGKLDTLNADSEIVFTVSKLSNCSGPIDGLSLEGPDADKFHGELDTTGAKPLVRLTMLEGVTYATNVTYKVQFRFTICGQEVQSSVVSFKVTQSALKLEAAAKTCILYQSQTVPMTCAIALTSPASARIGEITLSNKTSPDFLTALGGESGLLADIRGSQATLLFDVRHPENLGAGKSYTVILEITPENCATNVKPVQLKLTVKVLK